VCLVELHGDRTAEQYDVVAHAKHGLEPEPESADLLVPLSREVGVEEGLEPSARQRLPVVRDVERICGEDDLDPPASGFAAGSVDPVLYDLDDLAIAVASLAEACLNVRVLRNVEWGAGVAQKALLRVRADQLH
jgi:hypothetical protein